MPSLSDITRGHLFNATLCAVLPVALAGLIAKECFIWLWDSYWEFWELLQR